MKTKIFQITSRILFLTGLLLLTASALMVGAGSEMPKPVQTTQVEPETTQPIDENICGLSSVECPDEQMIRTVTAYNTVEEQCDSTPCISANGTDICKGMAEGKHYVATNELPFGTLVEIAGTVYEVVDRTNSRYQYRYDIAFPADQIQEAIAFGVKNLPITIIQ